MLDKLTLSGVLEAFVPISRFNKGEANKIFDEVRTSGFKVVIKNNAPACILLAPEQYKEIMQMIEEQYLLALAEERIKTYSGVTDHHVEEDDVEFHHVDYDEEEEAPEYGVDFG